MNARPTKKKWITIFLISLCIIGSALANNHSLRDLKGSTVGTLNQGYSVETESRNGVETNKSYKVSYSFQAEGKQYQGSDTLKAEPASQDCTVYFDLARPEINALRKDPVDLRFSSAWLGLGALAMFVYFWLPIGPNRSIPEMVAPVEGGVGDAAGEYLTMAHGQYEASGYVWFAFFGQIVLIIWAGTHLAQLITAGRVNADLVTIGVCLVAISSTFWIYWNRWRCIAAYGSRYTSGCVNISMFYVPLAVCLYANYRGFLKLRGR